MAYHVICQFAHRPIYPRHSPTHLPHCHYEPWGGAGLGVSHAWRIWAG
ncbi:hypothetical protein [Moraxella lacunata]